MGRNQKVPSESYREISLKMARRWVWYHDIQPEEILNNCHGTQHSYLLTVSGKNLNSWL